LHEGEIARIRSAEFSSAIEATPSFALSRRGYDKDQVDRFLADLADRLEQAEGERTATPTRGSESVRRELELMSQKTGELLAQADRPGRVPPHEPQGNLQVLHGSSQVPPRQVRGSQQAVRVFIPGVPFQVIGKDPGGRARQSARQVADPSAIVVAAPSRLVSHGRQNARQGRDILPGGNGRAHVLGQPPLRTGSQVKPHLEDPLRPLPCGAAC